MKMNFLIFLILLNLKGCDSKSNMQDLNSYSLIYSEQTRGRQFEIKISQGFLSAISSGIENFEKKKRLTSAEGKEVLKILNEIDLQQISNLQGAAEAFTVDRAPMAQLSIERDGQLFESSIFDAGSPPDELQQLIEQILELAETVE